MATEEIVSGLLTKLETVFDRGFTLDSDVMHYIDSTFLSPPPEEIKDILEDPSNCDREPLIELIFFPDEAMQEEMEEILDRLVPSSEEEKALIVLLEAGPIGTKLLLPSGETLFETTIPESAATQFLSRLKITRKLETGVRSAIEAHVEEDLKGKVKVRLRNKPQLSGSEADFVCLFFEKIKARGKRFLAHFDFLLGFLGEIEEGTDLYPALVDKKRFYYQNIKQAEKFDQYLGTSNIETLMMKGITPLSIDKDDLRNKMDIIDRICQRIFGKTEFFGDTHRNVDLGSFEQDSDLSKVLKALS